MVTILEIYFAKAKSDLANTWREALGRSGDSEWLEYFHTDIQDGHHGDHLEIL